MATVNQANIYTEGHALLDNMKGITFGEFIEGEIYQKAGRKKEHLCKLILSRIPIFFDASVAFFIISLKIIFLLFVDCKNYDIRANQFS